MTEHICRIRLMFEWGGGALWCGNDVASARFCAGPIEESLPLSLETLARINTFSTWHDTSLNWDYPPDPGPWSAAEYSRFDEAVMDLLTVIQRELGGAFVVVYERL